MSHTQTNVSRTPKAKGRRLTFAVTVSAPTGMTLPQWQEFIRHSLQEAIASNSNIEAGYEIVVKLLKTTTTYEVSDE